MPYAIFAMLFYSFNILLIMPMLLKIDGQTKPKRTLFLCSAFLAVICHYLSFTELFTHLTLGADITLLEVSSLMSFFIALLSTVPMLWNVRTLAFVSPIVYGFALINLLMTEFIPSQIVHLQVDLLLHILISMLAYAVCFIAMLYSIQIAWLDRHLKRKKVLPSPDLPPLMLVERHFFRVMLSGEILLTIILFTGTYHLLHALQLSNIHKAVFSLFAWVVFGILLVGHWKWHWRGKRMIIFTISGMILLTIAYFGSKFFPT
ncbi:cytochrome C assembly family protein [Lonepinella sp. BR2919]|uniref:cytochrome C assembly family protein n=1 Tax=unclassified Lonepinella TaxID=2642006 RepID=UPI003F6E2177